MDTEDFAALPSSREIMERLAAYNSNDPYMVSRLYPKLAELGGRELYPEGVAFAVALALSEYTEGFLDHVTAAVYVQVEGLVRAMLKDYPYSDHTIRCLRAAGVV